MPLSEEQLLRADYFSWIQKRWLLPSGKRYSFKRHEYLEQIAKHQWKKGDQVFIRKPSQVGASEIAIAWPLWMNDRNLPDWQGSGYFFPARSQLTDHLKARLFPAFDGNGPESQYLRSKLGQANLRYVGFNGKPIYFRSGQTRRELISSAMDCAVIDEFDEFENPIEVVPTIESRFEHSEHYGYLFGLSTPTIPDTGIDQAFSLSNQYNWHVKCQRCKKTFAPLLEVITMGFERCVDRAADGTVGFVCPMCHELTDTNNAEGFWHLDQKKDNQKYAYGLSRLFTSTHSLKKLLVKYEEALNMQEFYNSILGIAYAAENARLSKAGIVECCTGPEKHISFSEEPCWMGIDVGKKCHWVVGRPTDGHKQIYAYGACSFDQLDAVKARYNVKHCVIDLRPYEQEVKKFIGDMRGFWACDFNTGHQEDWYRRITADGETRSNKVRIIKADKTQCCDILIREIMAKKSFVFPGSTRGDNLFMNQMCAPVRIEKTDKDTGDTKAIYGNGGKADHYFFALVYFLLACELRRGITVTPGGRFM
jgi:hypothetical protein